MKNSAYLIIFIVLLLGNLGIAQSPNVLNARKVQDYFQDVESKSYYQQERIRSMKGEMNEYSERLHDLQEKFHNIFYGKSTDVLHQDPFGEKEKISYPKRKYREPLPPSKVESIVRKPTGSTEQKIESNQLAFTVDKSETFPTEQTIKKGQPKRRNEARSYQSPPASIHQSKGSREVNQKALPSANPGAYIILRPGVTFPHSSKLSVASPSKEKKRKYKPGEFIMLSAGYDWGKYFLGGGLIYRRNKHDDFPESYEKNINALPFNSSSDSKSTAVFLEIGYEHPLGNSFHFTTDLGLGYGISVVEDYSPLHPPLNEDRTRVDPFFYGSAGVGFSWSPNDLYSLHLGYRYFYEEEVPAHAAQIGLKGNF